MFLLIDKPKGITSHDVIDRIRKIAGEKRVGHAGTLDPNATGLLIVGIGREFTKKLSQFLKLDKEYEAEIFLGEERDTEDALGEIRNTKYEVRNKSQFSKLQIIKKLDLFIGEQMQMPPSFSAIKMRGKKAYELARKGINPDLSPRKITIYSIKLLEYKYPVLRIRTKVSSGTYIRALARDLGRKLGCGAYLLNLRRTRIGKYSIKEAVSLSDIEQHNSIMSESFEF